MGRPGACSVCCRSDRKALDDAHAAGTPTRSLARDFNVAESSLRKHFAHAGAKARPAPAPVPRPAPVTAPAAERYRSGPTRGSMPFEKVRAAAELLGIPLAELTMCISEHAACDITVTGDDDEEALYAEFDRADEDAAYVADVARHGTFLAGNGT